MSEKSKTKNELGKLRKCKKTWEAILAETNPEEKMSFSKCTIATFTGVRK